MVAPLGVLALALVGHDAAADITFTESAATFGANVVGAKLGGVAWAELDGKPGLDLLVGSNAGTKLLFFDPGAMGYVDVTQTHGAEIGTITSDQVIIAADANNDGYVDLAQSEPLGAFFNGGLDSIPTYQLGFSGKFFAPDNAVAGMAWADVNLDGWLDLVFESTGFTVGVYLNPADGGSGFTFSAANSVVAADAGGQSGLAMADFDGDGDLDVAVRGILGTADVWENVGGAFLGAFDVGAGTPGSRGTVMWCDLDDDGDFDLLWSDGAAGGVSSLFENDGGQFQLAIDLASDIQTFGCGDFDNDGDLDLFLGADDLTIDGSYQVLDNTGTGDFTFTTVVLETGPFVQPAGVSVGDFQRDGDLDVLANDGSVNRLWLNDTDDGNALVVEVKTTASSCPDPFVYRDAIGTTLRLYDGTVPASGIRQIDGGASRSQNEAVAHFGLANIAGPDHTYDLGLRLLNPADTALIAVRPGDLPGNRLVVLDNDPDGDHILTADEKAIAETLGSGSDFDSDDYADWNDPDADGDGLSDAFEAGDDDPCTAPLNHDDDPFPDYLDTDSDNDTVLDELEVNQYMTDPYNPDSDGGGVDDGVEIAQGTNPLDPSDDVVSSGAGGEGGALPKAITFRFAGGGCSCQAEGSQTTGLWAWLAAVAVAGLRRRRP